MNRTRSILASVCFWFLLAFPIQAQSPLSKIVGTVQDTSGAVVPGVEVTVIEEGTGLERSNLSDDVGYYEVDLLRPGIYTVQGGLPGFKRWVRRDVPLRHRQTLRIDMTLETGEISEDVTVTGAAPVVASETAEVMGKTGSRKHYEYYQGMDENFAGSRELGTYGYSAVAIGWRAANAIANQHAYRQEGLDINARFSDNTPPDHIDQFTFQYAGAKADSGHVVKIDLQLRGGTNDFHGKIRVDLKNPGLNALGPNPNATRSMQTTDKFWFGSVSGPVIKDKTFFWFSYLWFDQNQRAFGRPSIFIPPPAWRGADFSQVPANLFKNQSQELINPFTGDPFPNNTIPDSMIWQGATNFQTAYPQPNFGNTTDPHFSGLNWQKVPGALQGRLHGIRKWRTSNAKVDHYLTENDTLGYTFTRTTDFNPVDTSEMETFVELQGPVSKYQHSISWTHTFSPTVLNEFRGGMGHSLEPRELGTESSELGYTGTLPVGGISQLELLGISWRPEEEDPLNALSPVNVCIDGVWSPLCGRPATNQRVNVEEARNLINNVSIHRGNHSFKTGIEYGWWRRAQSANNPYGSFTFDGRFTGLPYGDFLLGIPGSSARDGVLGRIYPKKSWFAAFFQDDWKVRQNVTLELGLRFEHHPVGREINRLMVSFDPDSASFVVADEAFGKISPLWDFATFPVLRASEAGFPELLKDDPQPLFYPRVGIAWRPSSTATTVVRGSVGLFATPYSLRHAQAAGQGLPRSPFALAESFDNVLGTGGALFAMPFPFPTGPGAIPGQSAFGVSTNFPMPRSLNWSLTVEREIMSNTAVRLSYMGNTVRQLGYRRRIDKPIPGPLPYRSDCASQPAGSCVGPVFDNFSSVTFVEAGGTQHGNMLQAELHRRWAEGLEFQIDFAWSKTISDAADVGRGFDKFVGSDFGPIIENPYDRRRERGIHPRDVPFRFIFHHVWELPLGNGRRWLNTGGALDYLVGGWAIWGAWAKTARVFNTPLWSGVDFSNTNTFTARPDLVSGCNPTIDNWSAANTFNSDCFELPPNGRFGNAGNTIYKGRDNGGFFSRSKFAIYKHLTLVRAPFAEDGVRFRIGFHMVNPTNTPWLLTSCGGSGFGDSNTCVVNRPGASTGFYGSRRTITGQLQIEF